MSRAWSRSYGSERCGRCGHVLERGEPVLIVSPHPDRLCRARFRRCQSCVGDAPPDLPAIESQTRIETTSTFARLAAIAAAAPMPRDFKLLQGGRDE